MKLLAFVLLGFLAHSCSGTCQTSHKQFQNDVCDTFSKNFENYEDCDLLPFNILNLGQVIATVTGLVSLQTDLQYQSNNLYQLDIAGALSLKSLSITGLSLSIHVTGQLGVFVKEGCREVNLIESSLGIKLEVLNQAVFLGIGGGVLGDITGIVTKTILNSFTSNCQQSLPGKILEILESSLDSLNTKSKDITTPVYSNGNWFKLLINDVSCTADSIVENVDLLITTATDAVATTVSLGTELADSLEQGVGSSICFTGESIGAIVNVVLDNVIPGCEKTVTNAKWKDLGLYPGIEGDLKVTPTKTKDPSCNIQSSGSSLELSLDVEVSDGTGHSFLKINLDVEIDLDLSINNGITALSLGGTSISNKQVAYKDVGCGCEDDGLLDSVEGLIEDIVGGVVSTLTGALDEGLPCISFLTESWPPESDCAGGDEVFTCRCPYY